MEIEQRATRLGRFWYYVVVAFSILGIVVVIDHVFLLRLLGRILIYNSSYLYALLTIYLSLAFILYPAKARKQGSGVLWYDVLAFLCIIAITVTFIANGYEILLGGWVAAAPLWASSISIVLLALVIEAARRTTGLIFAALCLLFLLYPVFASHLPGVLEGHQFSFLATVGFHVLSTDSIIGLAMNVVGNLVVGFMMFGVVLVVTGGGKFFFDFANALFGFQRGGAAKVAVVASGLFGSMSGSSISNVVTTGSVTIPTMKRIGYSPTYAGAIEACASAGGMVMPPIMAAVAFIMATMLNITYLEVVIAAIIPAILYYVALFFQVDGYAGRKGLTGLQRSEIPQLKQTLKAGWPYLLALGALIYFLFLRLEARAPFYAMGILLLCTMLRKETRLHLRDFTRLFVQTGSVIAQLVAILAAVGVVMGALIVTGVGHSLSREIVSLAGGNTVLLLIFGAMACYILGMGMPIIPVYIFLAIVLAPGLVSMGFNLLAVHMFILYWGLTSTITPPVAITAYVAAGISGAPPFKTGFLAMRLGIILYLVPFFFILNPALVLQTPLIQTVLPFITCLIGIYLLAGGLEGYLIGLEKPVGWKLKVLLCIAGFAMCLPEWRTDILAVCMVVPAILYLVKKSSKKEGSLMTKE